MRAVHVINPNKGLQAGPASDIPPRRGRAADADAVMPTDQDDPKDHSGLPPQPAPSDGDGGPAKSSGTFKLVSRSRHIEYLLFSLCDLVLAAAGEELFDLDEYDAMRHYYKSLSHNRRPDGSKY